MHRPLRIDYVIPGTLLCQGHPLIPGYPPATGQRPANLQLPGNQLPNSPARPPLPTPTHRHPIRVFLPNLFTFLFPILEGMVFLILELHDGPQVWGLPGQGLLRALVSVSRVWPPLVNVNLITIAPHASATTRPSPHYVTKRLDISREEGKGPPGKEIERLFQDLGTQKHQGGVVTSRSPASIPPPAQRIRSIGVDRNLEHLCMCPSRLSFSKSL